MHKGASWMLNISPDLSGLMFELIGRGKK